MMTTVTFQCLTISDSFMAIYQRNQFELIHVTTSNTMDKKKDVNLKWTINTHFSVQSALNMLFRRQEQIKGKKKSA